MRNLKLLGYFLITFFVSGCSTIPFTDVDILNGDNQEVAVLTDYELNNGFITIKAVGHGCTFFDSFKVEVANKQSNSLKVVRTRPDECGMKPRNVSLQYSFKHLGLDLEKQVKVDNPVEENSVEASLN